MSAPDFPGLLTLAVTANIRAARARRELGQEDVAARMAELGFTTWRKQTIALVERGLRRLAAEEVLGLAVALDTPVGTLLDLRDSAAEWRLSRST